MLLADRQDAFGGPRMVAPGMGLGPDYLGRDLDGGGHVFSNVKLQPLGKLTFYASSFAVLNSNVLTGGGTDDTSALNTALVTLGALGGGLFILDGAALISATLRVPSNVTIYCPNKACGVFLANGSNCHMATNSNFTATTNPSEPSAGQRQKNISIVGGTWNGNYAGQSKNVANNGSNAWCAGMWFNGVDNFGHHGVTIYDARTFALMLTYHGKSDVIDYTAQWPVKRNDNNDCIHTWGPAPGKFYGRNFHFINGNDDSLAFNYTESSDPGNGGVVWSGQAAAVCVDVDGVLIENGCSIMRVDAAGASVGSITVRNVVANNLGNAGGEALVLLAFGIWDRLRCENWTIKTPAGVPFDWAKNCHITPQGGCGDTELVNWRHTGPSAITGTTDFITIYLGDTATPARKILLDNVIVDKPSASRVGSLVAVIGTATALALRQIEIRNCELVGAGYASLFSNSIAAAAVGSLDTGDGNHLNGAVDRTGSSPVDQNAWTTYAPTITTGSGTITTLGTVTCRYKQIGKTVFYKMTIGITTNGTGAGSVQATLPVTPKSGEAFCSIGNEDIVGKTLLGYISYITGKLLILSYDQSYPGGDNKNLVISGSYEAN